MKEPTSLTKSAISKLSREEIYEWANGRCLLEHLTADDMTMSKKDLVNEVMGALLRVEVAEDHHAAATDTVARSTEELIGGEAKPAKATPKTSVKTDPESTKQINEGRAKLARKATAKQATARRKLAVQPTADEMSARLAKYEALTDAKKAATLRNLRDTKQQGWRDVRFALGMGASRVRTEYSRHVRPFTESVVFEGVGRPSGTKQAAAKVPAKKAPATRKATAAKKATATKATGSAKKVVSATKRAATAKRTGGTKVTQPTPEADTA